MLVRREQWKLYGEDSMVISLGANSHWVLSSDCIQVLNQLFICDHQCIMKVCDSLRSMVKSKHEFRTLVVCSLAWHKFFECERCVHPMAVGRFWLFTPGKGLLAGGRIFNPAAWQQAVLFCWFCCQGQPQVDNRNPDWSKWRLAILYLVCIHGVISCPALPGIVRRHVPDIPWPKLVPPLCLSSSEDSLQGLFFRYKHFPELGRRGKENGRPFFLLVANL